MSERIEAPGWSYEEILADLKETARVNRLKRLAQAAPKPPEQKLADRCAAKPTEAIIDTATRGNDALADRLETETMEQRRQKRMAKELAEYSAEGSAWHNLVQWQQSVERVRQEIVRLPYHRRSTTVGRDDSDHNLHVSPEDQLWGKMK
jgi:hypothetical protein